MHMRGGMRVQGWEAGSERVGILRGRGEDRAGSGIHNLVGIRKDGKTRTMLHNI